MQYLLLNIYQGIYYKRSLTMQSTPMFPSHTYSPAPVVIERSSSVGQKDPYCDPVVSDPPTAAFANGGGIFQN